MLKNIQVYPKDRVTPSGNGLDFKRPKADVEPYSMRTKEEWATNEGPQSFLKIQKTIRSKRYLY